MPIPALAALQAIAAVASLIDSLKSIFDGGTINDQLSQLLTELQDLRVTVIRGIADILAAIDGIRRQIDEITASENMALADRALFSDLAIFDDKQQAMGNSFQAADVLARQTDVTFAASFMYVVNIRLAVMKDFDQSYFCNRQFRDEFQGYFDRLNAWIALLNELISQSHTVVLTETAVINPEGEVVPQFLIAIHYRNGVQVARFSGRRGQLDDATANRLLAQANASRQAGIETDRQQFGVVDMENTAAVWKDAFRNTLRAAIFGQVFNRRPLPTDLNRDGLLVDGRLISSQLDLRTTLIELLTSREFRGRVKKTWDAFVQGRNEKIARFAYLRLFGRDATHEEISLLHSVASKHGWGAFLAILFLSTEYEEKYGNGLPATGDPVIRALESEKSQIAEAT